MEGGESRDPDTIRAWVYILRLRSGKLYVGTTCSVHRRLSEHDRGLACRTTRLDPPEDLMYSELHPTLASARRRESQLKRWSRSEKEALMLGDIGTFQALSKCRHS
jgi:putative endonuclease